MDAMDAIGTFYQNHPEAQEGEVLIGFVDNLEGLGWKTKRAGKAFIKENGSSMIPVFIQKSEIKNSLRFKVQDWSEYSGTPNEW